MMGCIKPIISWALIPRETLKVMDIVAYAISLDPVGHEDQI